jgi:4-hydroxy-tetrahydrodipicolinate synthase
MGQQEIRRGVWPVMLTAFRPDKSIDEEGIARLTEWYIDSGVAGLFTVCLSSEMYALSDAERLTLARCVVQSANGRIPIVATGTFGGAIESQAAFVQQMAETGVAAVVCLVNQFAEADQPDDVWRKNVEALMHATTDIPLGLYECPSPYHRTLTPELLGWAAQTGRFHFLKETSARPGLTVKKVEAVRNTPLRFFNAHGPGVLRSLQAGGDGFGGIAANFFPDLYAWLCTNYETKPEEAERLQRFLTLAEGVVRMRYPASAKQYLKLSGVDIEPICRVCGHDMSEDEMMLLTALHDEVEARRAALLSS